MAAPGRLWILHRSNATIRTLLRGYRSPYSLDKLYPLTSGSKSSIPNAPSKPQDKEFNGYVPIDKIQLNYAVDDSRAAELRFSVKECDWIPNSVRDQFFERFKHRIDKEGYFVVRSNRTMVSSLNAADCLDKLRYSIRECALPKPSNDRMIKEVIQETRTKQEVEAKRKLQVKRSDIQ